MALRYTAAVCHRGHIKSDTVELLTEVPSGPCRRCGEPIITACPSCEGPILGGYDGVVAIFGGAPAGCVQCNSPLPWAAIAPALRPFSDNRPRTTRL